MCYSIKKTDGEIISLRQIKDIEFHSQELDSQITIGDFLIELLATLWTKKDQFSGKRPFGKSSWEYDLYSALVENNIVKGKFDELGYIEDVDISLADKIILDIILIDV
jgi:hypothetical protein